MGARGRGGNRADNSARRRLIGLCVVGSLLAGAAALYPWFCLRRPVGAGPAGPAVPRDAFARPWTERPVLLVGLGDSVTAGFGASKGHSYFQRLAANPEDEFPDMKGICLGAVLPRLKVRNLAVSGSTSLEHLQDQVPRVPPAGPETFGLVVMTTGGNDIIHNYGRTPPREGAMYGATVAQAKPWIASFEKRLDAMVRRIEGRFPGGCRIYLANVYDPTDGVGDAQNAGLPGWRDGLPVIRAYNEVIARCPRRHPSVRVVNLHDAFLGHGIHCAQFWRREYRKDDPRYWYYENLEDPNDRGYDAIRRLFLIEMARDASSIR